LKAVQAAHFAMNEGLLIVTDQFEELFRFREEQPDGGAEANLFVTSLLEAADGFAAPIYVVLTMRSDFLGDCTRFAGLAEALNRSQYLIPRLTREQRREAIEKPVRMVDAVVAERLVERLLNELGEDSDQLPVMQHALNRTFRKWKEAGAKGEIDFEHYEAAHTVEGALNDHADELMAQVTWAARPWTEKVFRALTITLANGRAVRRPTRFDVLVGVLGIEKTDGEATTQVRRVVEKYAERDNSLLMCSPPGAVEADTVVDISHESLITRWAKLKQWVRDEASAVSWYHSAAEDAVRHINRQAPTWRDPKLSLALAWVTKGTWNEAWAQRNFANIGIDFEGVQKFLRVGASEQRSERRRIKIAYGLIGALLVAGLIALGAFAWELKKVSDLQKAAIQSQTKVTEIDNKTDPLRDQIAEIDQKIVSPGVTREERVSLDEERSKLMATLNGLEEQKANAEQSVELATAIALNASTPEKVKFLISFLEAVLKQNYDAAWSDFSADYQSKHDMHTWSNDLADRSRQHGGGLRYHVAGLQATSCNCVIWYKDGSSATLNISLGADSSKALAVSDFRIGGKE